jgi:hypothetical protein
MIIKINGFSGNYDIHKLKFIINNNNVEYEFPTEISGDFPYSLIIKYDYRIIANVVIDEIPKKIEPNGFDGLFFNNKYESDGGTINLF